MALMDDMKDKGDDMKDKAMNSDMGESAHDRIERMRKEHEENKDGDMQE